MAGLSYLVLEKMSILKPLNAVVASRMEKLFMAFRGRKGTLDSFTCYAGNGMPIEILSTVAKAFKDGNCFRRRPGMLGV
jgi:hypothetical protein